MSDERVSVLAALSCKETFLVAHRIRLCGDLVIFLTQGGSLFHLNQDIVLPFLCPNSKHPKEVLHTLRFLRFYEVYSFILTA